MCDMAATPVSGSNHHPPPHHHNYSHSSSLHSISAAAAPVEYSYRRRRLYPAIPNRTFICVRAHRVASEGELELRKGDVVELLSVGDAGYWEGRLVSTAATSSSSSSTQVGHEGWFKQECVEEFIMPKSVCSSATNTTMLTAATAATTSGDLMGVGADSVVVKRKTLLDLIAHADFSNVPRTVVLQRGKKGFGFVLRGAKS